MKTMKSTLVLASILALSTGTVRAEDSTLPAENPPSSAEKPEKKDPCNGGTGAGNVQQYCNAAKAADEAADSNQSAMMIHAAVAATCAAACAGSYTGVANTWCTYASIGGTVADMMVTKNFANSMMGLVGAAGSLLVESGTSNAMGNKMLSKVGGNGGFFGTSPTTEAAAAAKGLEPGAAPVQFQNAAGGTEYAAVNTNGNVVSGPDQAAVQEQAKGADNDAMACAKAALEGFTTFQRSSDASMQEDIAKQNRDLAAQYNSTGASSGMSMTPVITAPSAPGSGGGSSPTTGGSSPNLAGSTGSSNADICNRGGSGDFHAAIQCAVASDKTVPSFVNDPRFARDLTKATGMSPNAFAKKVAENGAAAAMGGAFGAATGSADLGAKMGALYAGLQRQVMQGDTGRAYAGTGGGRRGGGGEPGLDKIFGDLMGQFGPKKGQEKSPGVRELAFGNGPKRYPANVEEDRRVSIFERVAARYFQVSDRVMPTATGPRIYK